MPRTKEQFEEIRSEKIKMIKRVALELFANEGYYQTSISKIAKAANISKGLLYNYFESKEDLLKDIVVSGTEEMYQSFDPNHDGILTGDEFEIFVRETFNLQKKKREFYKMYFSLLTQPSIQNVIGTSIQSLSGNVMRITYQYFEKHFDDPEAEMMLYASTIKGLSMLYTFSPQSCNDELLEKLINKIIKLYKR